MRTLNRKLRREVWHQRGPLLSIALIVMAGVMSVVTMWSTFRSLETARDSFYAEYRFAHVFASLKRAPQSVAERIAAIDGVAAVDTRVTTSLVLTVPGLERPATGQVIGIPETGQPRLNLIRLGSGRWPSPGAGDEILLSERFARTNRLSLGDTIVAVLNGRQRTLRVVGLAMSPEYVYEVTPGSGFVSDERLFGILWMGRQALAAATNMEGAFNEVAVRLAPGASEAAIIERLDDILTPWGGVGAYGRDDQLSNRILRDEIAQNRSTATAVPIVFLSVAAFLLHIVLMRLVTTEREQIALLKAFGYRNSEVAMHYLALALVPVAVGAAAGIAGGIVVGSGFTDLYARFFQLPDLRFRIEPALTIGAILISLAAAVAGAISAVRAAIRLEPAVAMRGEAPAVFKPLALERWNLHRWLSAAQRMVLRNVERRPVRTLLSAIGVGFALAVLLIGLVLLDSVEAMIDQQFRQVQREDMTVTFTDVVGARAVREIGRLPGVVRAEPYRTVPIALHNGHIERRLGLTGLPPGSTLRPMIDEHGYRHPLPASGAVLTRQLAKVLGVRPGDTIRAELLDRGGEERDIHVVALVEERLGVNAYMALPELHRFLREGPRVSGVYLDIERGREREVIERLAEIPAVGSTASKAAMLESFEAQMAEGIRITMGVVFILSAVLAVGVIYNGARIALSERGRELAGLRVIGFTRTEVAAMLLGEQAVITMLGLPLGVLAGYGISQLIASAYQTELYRMPLVFRPDVVLIASVLIIFVATAAGLLVRRQLDRADLIAVLKSRD